MFPWHKNKIKISIAIPHGELVFFNWFVSTNKLSVPPDSVYTFQRGLQIGESRDYIVQTVNSIKNYDDLYIETLKSRNDSIEKSIDMGADYIFFLDSDITIPSNTILSLMAWHYPFMNGYYYKKKNQVSTDLYILDSEGYKAITSFKSQRLMFVDGVGMGISLIDTRLFKKMSPPYFDWESIYRNPKRVSEDLYFCRKLWDEVGIKPGVDTYIVGEHTGGASIGNGGATKWVEM